MVRQPGKRPIDNILEFINERVTVDAAGGISAPFDFDSLFRVLCELREFPSDIARAERRQLIRDSISSILSGGGKRVTESNFRVELAKQIGLRRKHARHLFEFSAWIVRSPAAPLPRSMRWHGTSFRLKQGEPNIPELDRVTLSEVINRFPLAQFDRVRVDVEARSIAHAADLAEDLFSEWRGCIDFLASFREVHWLYRDVPTPLTKIVTYPVFVVRQQEGGVTHSWYNLTDVIKIGKGIQSDDLSAIRQYLPWTQRRLKKHFDQDRIYHAFRAYCAAVDSANYDTGLQRLWTTLEILVDSDQSEVVIARVASLYRDRNWVTEMLGYFAEARNRIAHAARGIEIDRTLVDMLKVHVHRVFQAHLINLPNARSLADLFETSKVASNDELFERTERILRAARSERRLRKKSPE